METGKGDFSLAAGRFRRPESAQPRRRRVPRQLPDFSSVPLPVVNLFQAEVLPVDDQLRTQDFPDALQPDRRIVNVGSAIIEVDVYFRNVTRSFFYHDKLPFTLKTEGLSVNYVDFTGGYQSHVNLSSPDSQ